MDTKPEINVGVHETHCCILHGCKYANDRCPVENGNIKQMYLCELCTEDGIKTLTQLHKVVAGEVKTCPHCGHVID